MHAASSSIAAPSPRFPASFFLTTFALSWAFWFLAWQQSRSEGPPFLQLAPLLLGSFGPSLVAFFLVFRERGAPAVWSFLVRGLDPRAPWPLYIFVCLVPILLSGIAYFSTGGNKIETDGFSLLGTFVLWFFLGGPFGEEFGWRSYALPRLLQRWSPLTASLVLGVIWSAWHWPLSRITGTTQSQTPQWVFFLSTTSAAVTYTWIWLRAGQKLFPVLLFHSLSNISVKLFPEPTLIGGIDRSTYVEASLSAALALALALLYGKQLSLSRDPSHSPR